MKRHILLALILTMTVLPLIGLLASNSGDIPSYKPYYPVQVEPDTTKVIYPIPVSTGNPTTDLLNQSPLYLRDPENIQTEVVYDPVTGQYTFKKKVGDFYFDVPTTLNQEEYLDYQTKKSITEYWKERRSQNAKSTTNGTSLIPPMFVGGKAFETIFGSNTVDIRPQGSVDLTFGIKHIHFADKPHAALYRWSALSGYFVFRITCRLMAKKKYA